MRVIKKQKKKQTKERKWWIKVKKNNGQKTLWNNPVKNDKKLKPGKGDTL